jgi:hypothetical protein
MRGHEVEPGALTRQVELSGNPEQISKAEQLIKEVIVDVLLIMFLDFCLLLCVFIYITIFDLAIYADVGSFGIVSGGRKYNAPQPGAETFRMKIANNKVCTSSIGRGFALSYKNTLYHGTIVFDMCKGACLSILYQSAISIVAIASQCYFFFCF